jgi:hypothetical protein
MKYQFASPNSDPKNHGKQIKHDPNPWIKENEGAAKKERPE